MNLSRLALVALATVTTSVGIGSCANRISPPSPHAYCDDDCASARVLSKADDPKKHITHTAEVLDCRAVKPRACSHVYPQSTAVELCNVTEITKRKDDGRLISGPNVGWSGNGRYEGVFVGIKVVGDKFLNQEAYYIYHIGMNVYPKDLPPEVIGELRGYCSGQPNIIGGKNEYTHCVCGTGAGGARREFCHIYKDGRIVDTIPGNDNHCR
jgi:hypothetical protein